MKNPFKRQAKIQPAEKTINTYSAYLRDYIADIWDGSKFAGSFGATKLFECVDYWTLRKRSQQLFTENHYARGVIRRLLRNEIFTGLIPDANVKPEIIWPEMKPEAREDLGVEYSEKLTNLFNLYGSQKNIFDFKQKKTFAEFQEMVRFETLICGDGIIISRINPVTKLPYWDFVNGDHIKTPMNYNLREGHRIVHGVELDKYDRQVAFHIETVKENTVVSERIPVRGEKSGRNIAWMVYGSETRVDDVRGEPLLACILYMLKELDRYRDAETRAAVVNAMLAMYVTRGTASPIGSRPTAGLTKLQTLDPTEPFNGDTTGAPRPRKEFSVMNPGTVFDDLAPGETINSFDTKRPNVNYQAFENAIIDGISWALEIPPEILRLKFQSNYSASRQANNEFQVYLDYQVKQNARRFCQPIYEEFVIQAALSGMVTLPEFIPSLVDLTKWDLKAAWLDCVWSGLSRPSVDPQKEVHASQSALDAGLTTYDNECRKTCGLSFRQVMQKRKREEEYMKQIGFVPHANEDNNGKPAYPVDLKDVEEEAGVSED